MTLRPSIDLVTSGPDGINVYREERDHAMKRGIKQICSVAILFDEKGQRIGARLDFGAAGAVSIFGFTDE